MGNITVYIFGLVWLTRFVGETQVLQLGLYPFLVGDALKLGLGLALIGGSSILAPRKDPTEGHLYS